MTNTNDVLLAEIKSNFRAFLIAAGKGEGTRSRAFAIIRKMRRWIMEEENSVQRAADMVTRLDRKSVVDLARDLGAYGDVVERLRKGECDFSPRVARRVLHMLRKREGV